MNFPEGTYAAIAADPAWRYVTWSDKGRDRCPNYDVMSLDEIKSLPVANVAAEHCVLFLWVIDPMLPHGLEVMDAWGFKFKTIGFTWAKTTKRSQLSWVPKYHFGMGHWTRANSELCLLGVRGKPKRIARNVRQLIVSPLREHSRKPDEFYDSVERLVDGPYLDLFSRETRSGWTAWGNEAGKFDEVA